MARRELALNEIEAGILNDLLNSQARAERDTKVAFAVLIAKHGLKDATFASLAGQVMAIEVPE